MQVVEDMEEVVLRLGKACKLLYVINNKYVYALVEVDKIVSSIVAYRAGQLKW